MEVRAHLFARSEHLILSSWLDLCPNEAQESLGTSKRTYLSSWETEKAAKKLITGYGENRCIDAAVATILLRSIERSLPNFGTWSPETGALLARNSRVHTDSRKLHLMPTHLFTINWSSGASFSWPNQYNLTWVPLYDQYVVTVSADSPEGLCGYTDLALGYFEASEDIGKCVHAAVVGDWHGQFMEWNQAQWTDIVETGLISTETLTRWAAEVWSEEREDEDRIEARI